jgi:hypothetical protein
MRTPEDIGPPVYLPQGVQELGRLVDRCTEAFRAQVVAACEAFVCQPSPAALLDLEVGVLRTLSLAASHVVAGVVALVQSDPAHADPALQAVRQESPGRFRHRGLRTTPVRFLGGARTRSTTSPCSSATRSTSPRRRLRGCLGTTG